MTFTHIHQWTVSELDPRYKRCHAPGCHEATANPDYPAPPAQRHSPTSVAAASAIATATPSLRTQVYEIIRERGGLTDEEGAEILGMSLNTYRPRRIELTQRGAVLASSRTRKTRSGHDAQVWIIM